MRRILRRILQHVQTANHHVVVEGDVRVEILRLRKALREPAIRILRPEDEIESALTRRAPRRLAEHLAAARAGTGNA